MITDQPITAPDGINPTAKAIADMAEPLMGDDPAALRNSRPDENPLAPPKADLANISDKLLPGPGGNLPVRIYEPKNFSSQAALIYYHGGGFVLGNIDGHDTVCQTLAAQSGYLVISVEYRLAPETKYPGAVDDAYFAYQWALENAETLGLATDRIAVGGDSAGGNLAITTVLKAQEAKIQQPSYQLLYYPVTDAGCDTDSYTEFADGYFLTKETMEWFFDHYLANPAQANEVLCSPLRATDLSQMPEGIVFTAGFDPLRDEGHAYAMELQKHGIKIPHYCFSDMIHGFISFAGGVEAGMTALQMGAEGLKNQLA